ncbi:YqgE/AlgH family protein [Amphritea sp. 1_MG-2023]|uniref:YqgE/AlgH family protein n=1 Tax=Amphritea sp. 1_MG-2023 TaxID=3062670 RepID=UPI0026E2E359|nr:YqgE/AlgH family protein [Amphritea sp. 1_MG-2023]MDO6562985.1 YqgE/AlgH family protein [Amphritea sp. 1_MG-2023]
MMTTSSASLYQPGSLQGHFLLSMPHLDDPGFAQSLIYICEHNESGAMGIVINQPTEMDLNELLQLLEFNHDHVQPGIRIYTGGPVQADRGFILHCHSDNQWDSSYPINAQVSLTTSMDILQAISENRGPDTFLVALGYAGWGAGQLEHELSDNAWLSCPANLDIMFHTPAQERLQAAAASMGINLNLLTSQSGHA